MSDKEKKNNAQKLWRKARIEVDKIRFKHRLLRFKETNEKELYKEDAFETHDEEDEQDASVSWYYIDTTGVFCRGWNQLITISLIYNMCVIPFILVFPNTF